MLGSLSSSMRLARGACGQADAASAGSAHAAVLSSRLSHNRGHQTLIVRTRATDRQPDLAARPLPPMLSKPTVRSSVPNAPALLQRPSTGSGASATSDLAPASIQGSDTATLPGGLNDATQGEDIPSAPAVPMKLKIELWGNPTIAAPRATILKAVPAVDAVSSSSEPSSRQPTSPTTTSELDSDDNATNSISSSSNSIGVDGIVSDGSLGNETSSADRSPPSAFPAKVETPSGRATRSTDSINRQGSNYSSGGTSRGNTARSSPPPRIPSPPTSCPLPLQPSPNRTKPMHQRPSFLWDYPLPTPETRYNANSFLGAGDPHDGKYYVPPSGYDHFLQQYHEAHSRGHLMFLTEAYHSQPFRFFLELDFDWDLPVDAVLEWTHQLLPIALESVQASYQLPAIPSIITSVRTPFKVHINFPTVVTTELLAHRARDAVLEAVRAKLGSNLPVGYSPPAVQTEAQNQLSTMQPTETQLASADIPTCEDAGLAGIRTTDVMSESGSSISDGSSNGSSDNSGGSSSISGSSRGSTGHTTPDDLSTQSEFTGSGLHTRSGGAGPSIDGDQSAAVEVTDVDPPLDCLNSSVRSDHPSNREHENSTTASRDSPPPSSWDSIESDRTSATTYLQPACDSSLTEGIFTPPPATSATPSSPAAALPALPPPHHGPTPLDHSSSLASAPSTTATPTNTPVIAWDRVIDFPHGSFRLPGSRKPFKLDYDPPWVTVKEYNPATLTSRGWVYARMTFPLLRKASIFPTMHQIRVFEQSTLYLDAIYEDWSGYMLKLELRRVVREERKQGLPAQSPQPSQSSTRGPAKQEPKIVRVRFVVEEDEEAPAGGEIQIQDPAGHSTAQLQPQQPASSEVATNPSVTDLAVDERTVMDGEDGVAGNSIQSEEGSLTGSETSRLEVPVEVIRQESGDVERPVRVRMLLYVAPDRPGRPVSKKASAGVKVAPKVIEPSPVSVTLEL